MHSIWFKKITISEINQWTQHRLTDYLGIEFTAIGPDYLDAKMPVDDRNISPLGRLHGGATCVLAETIGSVAAHFCIDPSQKMCVGLEINVNHIKGMQNGFIFARAKPLHLGKSTQIWDIQVRDEAQSLIAVSRLTIAILKK